MVISNFCAGALLLLPGAPWPHEAASPATCQAAATSPLIVKAKARSDANPAELRARFALADAWSDAGCFNEAVLVLQAATREERGDQELKTRLRIAKSLVGEEQFFDALDRADAQVRLKRASFRCTSLADPQACSDALQQRPNDPMLLTAQGDALLRSKRATEALVEYRRALELAPNEPGLASKITAAEALQQDAMPPRDAPASAAAKTPRPVAFVSRRKVLVAQTHAAAPTVRYSNEEPASESH